MATIQLQSPDTPPDIYTRLYSSKTLEANPLFHWVVLQYTHHVANLNPEASREVRRSLNHLFDKLSPDEKLVAVFLNGKLD